MPSPKYNTILLVNFSVRRGFAYVRKEAAPHPPISAKRFCDRFWKRGSEGIRQRVARKEKETRADMGFSERRETFSY
jgi:hypothetical protein